MFNPFMLQLGQMFALRPTLQSLGITQAQLDQAYQAVLEHYCEHLIGFFTGADTRRLSRWRHLAQRLEQRLRHAHRTLELAPARAMVKAVLDYPDSGERAAQLGERAPQVHLVRRHGCLALVITRKNQPAWAFTLALGLERVEDASTLLADAEPLEHDVFEGWALGALEGALQRIAWIDPNLFSTLAALDRQLAWASCLADFFEPLVEEDNLRFELEQQLPDWLKDASPTGRFAYSQWLEALARFHEAFKGASIADAPLLEEDAGQDVDAEASRHTLFSQQLALQVQRLTLECSLKGEADVTHEGYRTLRAALKMSAAQRRLHAMPMGVMPLREGSGYAVGPPTGTPGPWILLRPGAERVVEQVMVAPNAGAALVDPFMTFYRDGVEQWSALFEHPLHTLARLKQVGGNFQGVCEATRTWRCEVSLLRNLALLLVCPGTEQPGDGPVAHPRVKRMDSQWAGAGNVLSVVQEKRLEALRRPPSASLGSRVLDGLHKGLYVLNNLWVYNRDDNQFNVLSYNRIAPVINVNIVEHQVVDNHEQPTRQGPYIARNAGDNWQIQRAPRLRRDTDALNPPARRAINAGRALSASLPQLLSDADLQSKAPGKLPVEVEEGLQHSAGTFDDAARTLQRAGSNAPLIGQLQDQARQLRAHGRYLRIEMTRQRLTPTLGDVQYLLDQKVIRIRRVASRVAETIDGAVDYLQEYEVLDLTEGGKPLWYAHFHYPSLETADDHPKAAHLKTAAQRRMGREYERETGHKVYRAPITNASGRQLFLGASAL